MASRRWMLAANYRALNHLPASRNKVAGISLMCSSTFVCSDCVQEGETRTPVVPVVPSDCNDNR
jgi:hypothetical protein